MKATPRQASAPPIAHLDFTSRSAAHPAIPTYATDVPAFTNAIPTSTTEIGAFATVIPPSTTVIPAQAGIRYRPHYMPECRIYGRTSAPQSAAFPIGRFNLPRHSSPSRYPVPPVLHARMSDLRRNLCPAKCSVSDLGSLTSVVIPAQAGISYRLHYTPECRIYSGASAPQSVAFPIGRFNLPRHSGPSRNPVPPALYARMSDLRQNLCPAKRSVSNWAA